jgi:indolepyruvate ferredoxin oxidoreductase
MRDVQLDDKYTAETGIVFMNGTQALVRVPMMQREIDRAAGFNTAGFISGYRGSPLGSYDLELWRAQKLLDQHDILFQSGVNEDLAATGGRSLGRSVQAWQHGRHAPAGRRAGGRR